MRREAKKLLKLSAVFLAVFAVFTVLVKFVDVRPIGPDGTSVGFAGINKWFHDLTGYNESVYKAAEYSGYLALVSVGAFGLVGLMQLLRGGFGNVDKRIWTLLGLYIGMLAEYVIFEKIIVNYRPVITDAAVGPEASYPSSHTVLGICCMAGAIWQIKYLLARKPALCKGLSISCMVLFAVIVACRLFSGVHWLTDIVGGALLSAALVTAYGAFIIQFTPKKRKVKKAATAQ